MLERILEPEVMDTPEEADAYDAMDHAEVNRRFVDDLLATGRLEGDILDVGTGTARIPIALVQRCPAVRVVASDLSVPMLDVARINLEIAGEVDRIRLDRVDSKQMPYADGQFDAVISNSLVHHIARPEETLGEIARVVKIGGTIFVRDLMRPENESELDRLVKLYAGHEVAEARRLFADSLHAALTLAEMRSLVASLGFSTESVTATSDRHWTWNDRRPGQPRQS